MKPTGQVLQQSAWSAANFFLRKDTRAVFWKASLKVREKKLQKMEMCPSRVWCMCKGQVIFRTAKYWLNDLSKQSARKDVKYLHKHVMNCHREKKWVHSSMVPWCPCQEFLDEVLDFSKRFELTFQGKLGKWKDKWYHIELKKDAKPFHWRAYPVAFKQEEMLHK